MLISIFPLVLRERMFELHHRHRRRLETLLSIVVVVSGNIFTQRHTYILPIGLIKALVNIID